MRSGNPALRAETFTRAGSGAGTQVMTLGGTVVKSAILLLLALTSALFSWHETVNNQNPIYMYVGLIGGLVFALITCFKQTWSPTTAPIYAVLEGLFLGGISGIFEQRANGIVFQAIGITFGVFVSLLAIYATGLIKPSENFKLGIVAATGGIFLVYLLDIVLRLFGVQVPFIHQSGMIGIGFSLFVVVIAALNLVLDFDFIEEGVAHRAPRYMEWYAAFGLMVTLVWLYLEILRLLSKLRD